MSIPSIFVLPRQSPLNLGQTVPGAKAFFFKASTTTEQAVYTTAALDTQHANPVEADSAGLFPVIYLNDDLAYRVQIKTAADVLVYDQDNINDPNARAPFYPQTTGESAAGVTPVDFSLPAGDVRRYGAVGDGATNDRQAIVNALAVSAQDKTHAYLPAGTYLVDSVITLGASATLIGDGQFRTRIRCNSATATVLTASSVSILTIQGIEIDFNVTRTAGNAISLSAVNQFLIRDVRILAPFNAITLDGCTNGLLDHVRVTTGTGGWNRGVWLNDCVSVECRFVHCIYGANTPGEACFTVESDCDTVEFYHCQAVPASGVGNAKGWRIVDTSATVPPRWVKLFGCTAEGGSDADIANAENGYEITSGTSIEFHGCYAGVSRNGVVITAGNGIRWFGGEIFANGRHGVAINGGSGVLIIGAAIHNNSQETANTFDGINVASNVNDFTITDCDIGTKTNFGTTSTHRYDISVSAGTSDDYIITRNRLKDGNTAEFLDSGSGTNKVVRYNLFGSGNIRSFADQDATPDVSVGDHFQTANTVATTITDFDGGYRGKEITVRIDVNTTIQDGANIATGTGADLTGDADDSFRFVEYNGLWIRSQ